MFLGLQVPSRIGGFRALKKEDPENEGWADRVDDFAGKFKKDMKTMTERFKSSPLTKIYIDSWCTILNRYYYLWNSKECLTHSPVRPNIFKCELLWLIWLTLNPSLIIRE